MIKDCFTDNTKVFDLYWDDIVIFDENKDDEYKTIAKKISCETGVPEKCIYAGKYGFRIPNWHKVDGEWYFYKSTADFDLYNELLGVVVSRYFQLDTVDYQIARLSIKDHDDRYGVVSKNFCSPDHKYSFLDLDEVDLTCFSQDLSVLTVIKKLCNSEEEYSLLQDDFKKMIVRDLSTGEGDRRIANFLFKNDGSGIRLAPLYDYSDSYLNIYNANRYITDFCDLDITKYDIQQFFRNDDRLQELLNMMMDANMDGFISEVEENHGIIIPDNQKSRFKRYDNKIKSLVLENRLIK